MRKPAATKEATMRNPSIERAAELGDNVVTAFEDQDVIRSYGHRPPYAPEVFAILCELSAGSPRADFDVGCGRGELARPLAAHVKRLDAVDRSAAMIEAGRAAPRGTTPSLCWIVGQVEDAPLYPPYSLITGGRSLHWMDWERILPRFQELLLPGGFLAIVNAKPLPLPWRDKLKEIIHPHSTDPARR
jgi:trans-aconitate methyltransferase